MNHRLSRLIFAVSMQMLLVSAIGAQNRDRVPTMAGARVEVYKTIDDVKLKAWIFEPESHQSTDQRPAIVFFFGGGWTGGSPTQFENHCRYFAEQGMVAIAADYRVLSRHGTPAIKCVQDAKSAVRWTRQNADRLGIDPNRIVASGGSAGGHIAACTGVVPGLDEESESIETSSVPNALALFNPALVLAQIEGLENAADRLRGIEKRTGIDPQRISPIHQLRSDLPPTIIFHGDQDTTVPYASVQLYTSLAIKAGGRCELMTYHGYGHGFFNHGREGDPGEPYRLTVHQLHQFLQSLGYLEGDPAIALPKSKNVHFRSHLDNSRSRFEQQKQATVAFIGGSITEMGDHGHSGMIEKFLESRFPNTEFRFVNAGISSTCSATGAFRLNRDVLRHNPDLLFVEFAVNDDQDAMHAERDCIRGMEGIIRQARKQNPNIDIVVTHFVNDPMLGKLQMGETPLTSGAHEMVARHYGVATNDLAREVAERITAGTLTWKKYGGTHPIEAGNRLAADQIEDLFGAAWSGASLQPAEHKLPKQIDPNSYVRGRLIDLEEAKSGASWTVGIPDWKAIPGSLRPRFEQDQLLFSDQIGAVTQLEFFGSAIGMYILAGPDAGTVEFSIDGGEFQKADLYHHFSSGLHYPRTVMLNADLAQADHQIVIRISEAKNEKSKGNAVRILNFVAN